ncbi:MAG: HAMP domain-containing protein [Candidatus Micrarchaeia archaeon]
MKLLLKVLLAFSGWAIAVLLASYGVFAGSRCQGAFGAVLAVLLVSPFLLWFVCKRLFLDSIERLTDAMDRVSRGETDVEMQCAERDDELGDLARAFERMVTSIRFAMRKKPPKKPGLEI